MGFHGSDTGPGPNVGSLTVVRVEVDGKVIDLGRWERVQTEPAIRLQGTGHYG